MIFVTGASRSGTTMLSRVLGRHSRVLGLRELHYFGDLCSPDTLTDPITKQWGEALAATLLARQRTPFWAASPSNDDNTKAAKLIACSRKPITAATVYAEVLHQLAVDANKCESCEQTPRYIFYAETLLRAYTSARIIYLVRDPRAVLASQKNRWRLRSLGTRQMPMREVVRTWINYHPLTMTKLWMSANERALRLVQHPRFKILRFEDLVSDAECEISRLCDFLNISFEPDMLDVPQWTSSHGTSDAYGISKEVVDKWRSVLKRGELAICETMACQLMQRFGYSPTQIPNRRVYMVPQFLKYPIHVAGAALVNPRRAWIHFHALAKARIKKSTDQE